MRTRIFDYVDPALAVRKKIKLSQLNHLLRVYHGLEMYDLESKIEVDDSRVNKMKYKPEIINHIEALIVRMQDSGIEPDNYIDGEYERELIALIEGEENYSIGESPAKLLCKRAAAIMRLNMEPKICFEKDVAEEASMACLLSGVIRLGVEFSPEMTLVLCIMATLLLILDFVKKAPLEIKKVDDETIELLEKECIKIHKNHFFSEKITEYSKKLKLKMLPQCFFSYKLCASSIPPISFLPIAKNGIIFLEKNLPEYFDREEIGAMIAHEMGHLKESQIFKKVLRIGIPMMSGFLSKLLSMLTEKMSELDSSTIDNTVNLTLMYVTTILCVRQQYMSSEYNADKIAIKLAGPLAHSSMLRTLENKCVTTPSDLNHSKWPRLFNTLKWLRLDDVFTKHPLTLKRMN